MNALDELQKWSRKHYSFLINSGGYVQPGDGASVILKGAGRSVVISDIDMEDRERDYEPSLNELVLEAIRLWHADQTLKNYAVVWWWTKGEPEPEPLPSNPFHSWEWRHRQDYGGSLGARLRARNETEALELTKAAVPASVKTFYIWEVSSQWSH